MKRISDIIEVVGPLETARGSCEVCASAEANYDEDAARLIVTLDAFLRTTDLLKKEERFQPGWLPPRETVRENVGPEETVELAREIFGRWVRKVRRAVPALAHD